MLGWEFYVTRQRDASSGKSAEHAPSLAYWKAGLGGTDWLDRLCSQGLATDLGGNGYPNRYVVTAGTLVAILGSGVPGHGGPFVLGDDYVQPSGWTGDARIDIASMRLIDPHEMLLVEAWDQS